MKITYGCTHEFVYIQINKSIKVKELSDDYIMGALVTSVQ